jgi:hypothetical protein
MFGGHLRIASVWYGQAALDLLQYSRIVTESLTEPTILRYWSILQICKMLYGTIVQIFTYFHYDL